MSKSQEPVAYLVTNGRAFSDRAFTHIYHAEASVAERKDGSTIVPLYSAPVSSEQQAAQQGTALIDALYRIRRYGLDTLSGRTDGPDDYQWQREAVKEMTSRAAQAIAAACASNGGKA